GTLGNSVLTCTHTVSDTNTSDFYTFSLDSTSHVNLSLTGFTGDADVRIGRDANNNGLFEGYEMISYSARRRAGIDESISISDMIAGDYLVQVSQYSGTNNYTLCLSNGYPSNLLPTEYDLGAIDGTTTFNSGYVGSSTYYLNVADTFRFSLDRSRTVNLTLAGMTNDIDLRLVQDINNNGVVDPDEVIANSVNYSDGAEWISEPLAAGTYFAQAYRWSGDSTSSNYYLSVSTGDWYSEHLTDAGIIGMARYFDTRNFDRRYEMMSILRAAKDYGNIDAAELTDLRTFVNGQSTTMPDYVHNLAYKVVNSNPANQWWTGGASTSTNLGNLYAGATADHLEKLIGKWFLGLDHPTAASTTTYRYTSGALFQNGIAYQDVVQGGLGDCYFCASIAGTAFRNPSTIQNMFIDNGDGTFTVRFYNNGVADYVTVDRYLPSTAAGGRYYVAWGGGLYNNTSNELWAALAEKAYAQVNESGWLGRGDSSNTYAALDGGTLSAISHITGLSNTGYLTPLSSSEIISAHNNNRIVYLSDGGHAYTLVGYSPTLGYQIYNPHGTTSWYSWAQVQATFVRWGYSGVRIPGAV
ncbi:MAG TPA: C2 family cysteine protease, partial [Candidatus Obscuribacterales bacterium]